MNSNDLSLAAWKRVANGLPAELHGYAREWGRAVERLSAEGTEAQSKLEWELWRCLCDALKECGAVTDADLKASVQDTNTPGCRLLQAIRRWGDYRHAIGSGR